MEQTLENKIRSAVEQVVVAEIAIGTKRLEDLLASVGAFRVVKTKIFWDDRLIEYTLRDGLSSDDLLVHQSWETYGGPNCEWWSDIDDRGDNWSSFCKRLVKSLNEELVVCPRCKGDGLLFGAKNDEEGVECPLCKGECELERRLAVGGRD